jgi:hypothetical protein
MLQVFVAQHPTEAYLVKGLLEIEGVKAFVRGESLFAARGEAPITPDTLPTVWIVDDGDAARAAAILADFGSHPASPSTAAESVACPQCGEMVEPQFATCWNCGHERE